MGILKSLGKLSGKARPGETVENAQTALDPNADPDKQKQARADLATEGLCGLAEKKPSVATVAGCGVAATNSAAIRYGGNPANKDEEGNIKPGESIYERAQRIERENGDPKATVPGPVSMIAGVGDALGSLAGRGVEEVKKEYNGNDGVARSTAEPAPKPGEGEKVVYPPDGSGPQVVPKDWTPPQKDATPAEPAADAAPPTSAATPPPADAEKNSSQPDEASG